MKRIVLALGILAVLADADRACAQKEPVMQTNGAPFANPSQAKDYLARALPEATRANPKYLTKADGSLTEWLTTSVTFASGATGAVEIAMDETYTRAGVATPGTHKASFSLADVSVGEFTEAGDVTPASEPARGLLFTCAKAGCIAAVWGQTPSRADKTDIYIQDDATRARILAALLILKDRA